MGGVDGGGGGGDVGGVDGGGGGGDVGGVDGGGGGGDVGEWTEAAAEAQEVDKTGKKVAELMVGGSAAETRTAHL